METSLYVNGIATSTGWTRVGTSPYLGTQNQPTDYIYSVSRNANSDTFNFADSSDLGTINSVTLYIYAYGVAETNFDTFINSTNTGLGPPTSWGWVSVDVSSILTTWAEINAATMYFDRANTADNAGVDCAYLLVNYTPPERRIFITHS